MKTTSLRRTHSSWLGAILCVAAATPSLLLAQESGTPQLQHDAQQHENIPDNADTPETSDSNAESLGDDPAETKAKQLERLYTRLARLREAEHRILASIEEIAPEYSPPSPAARPDIASERRGPHGSSSTEHERPNEPELTREQKIELLERMIRHTRPSLWENLQTLREEDPEAYEQRMDKLLRWGSRLIEEHQRDPVRFDYRMQELRIGRDAFRIAREIVQLEQSVESESTDDSALADKRAELTSLMEQQSRIQAQLREHEIARARELARQAQSHVHTLEDELVQFAADHASRVERHTDELLKRVRQHMERSDHRHQRRSPDRSRPQRSDRNE